MHSKSLMLGALRTEITVPNKETLALHRTGRGRPTDVGPTGAPWGGMAASRLRWGRDERVRGGGVSYKRDSSKRGEEDSAGDLPPGRPETSSVGEQGRHPPSPWSWRTVMKGGVCLGTAVGTADTTLSSH